MLYDGITLIDSSTLTNIIIENGTTLPSGEKGQLFYKDGAGLFSHNGTAWEQVGKSAADCITGVFPGDVTPITGTSRYYPRTNVTITNIKAWLSENAIANVVANIKKNNVVIQNVTILAGNDSMNESVSISLLTTDFITIDVVSGTGKDLTIRMDY